ncbi:glyoxalase [Sediminicola luteus]|uniref:Glyoxalase n=2 Tax=Sediminicola luteus TaxID=319238 RepID=A0A2A4G890_9FLAO|nr:glyoxalase [Sediminicola luteus]
MNNYIAIVEIPVTDTDRAREFYEKVMGLTLEQHKMPGMEMALFPYENQQVAIVLLKSEGYRPTAEGTTIYLNTGKDLQPILDRASKLGGQILTPKTAHADGSGFFALFLDSEGNRIGLHATH